MAQPAMVYNTISKDGTLRNVNLDPENLRSGSPIWAILGNHRPSYPTSVQ